MIVALQNQYFDSFLLQARGIDAPDGNATLVGSFIEPLPSISTHLDCLRKKGSSVTDRRRPIQMKNLTFTWMSPNTDFGQIRFIASLVFSKFASTFYFLSLYLSMFILNIFFIFR